MRTRDENEWVEIDKVLFPDVWRQKKRQEDRQANDLTRDSCKKDFSCFNTTSYMRPVYTLPIMVET